jgi:glutaredoxin
VIRVTLYGRSECHLCHRMRAVVDGVVRTPGLAGRVVVEEVDVDDDPSLAASYGADVPVLCVNGARAFKYRVEAAALRARLEREPD